RPWATSVRGGRFRARVERLTPPSPARRDELLNALAQKMPASACWTRPAGGFCCWLTLPRVPADFHQRALRQGMAFTPGEVFLVEPDENAHVRLCFSGLSPDLIREAITILGRLVEETTLPSPRVRGLTHALPLV